MWIKGKKRQWVNVRYEEPEGNIKLGYCHSAVQMLNSSGAVNLFDAESNYLLTDMNGPMNC